MNQGIALLAVVWVGWLALGMGREGMRLIGVQFSSSLERRAFHFALGAGVLAYAITLLGVLQLFQPILLLGLGVLLTLILSALSLREKVTSKNKESFFEISNLVYLPLLILFLLAVIQALVPSTAHDALAYQLDIPKRFVQAGGILYLPYSINSTFPLLTNMYYALALLWDSTRLANLFHLMHGVGLVLGILALARNYLPKPFAVLAAFIFCATPALFNQMTIAYNDVSFCFYLFFALFAAHRWDENREIRWIVLSGILTGFALSVKYIGVFAGALIGLLMMFRLIRKEIGAASGFKAIAAFGLAVFICSFFWYGRCYFYEHQWLYFGQIGYEATNRPDLWKYLSLPFMVTFFPERFGGSWTQIGPIYLAFLPLIFFVRPLSPWAKKILFFGLGYFLLWLFLPRQNLRFLFSALPFFALLIAYAIHRLTWNLKVKQVIAFLLGAILLLEIGLAFHHGKNGYRVALGFESETDYLERNERTFQLARFMNENLPKEAKVLNAYEVRMFYINAQVIREAEYRGKTKYDQVAQIPEKMIASLKQDGFTHILWTPGYEAPLGSLPHWLSGNHSSPLLEEIYRQPESAAQGAFVRYFLYRIR